MQQCQFFMDLLYAIRAFIQIQQNDLIDSLMVDRLMMSGVMQTHISIA